MAFPPNACPVFGNSMGRKGVEVSGPPQRRDNPTGRRSEARTAGREQIRYWLTTDLLRGRRPAQSRGWCRSIPAIVAVNGDPLAVAVTAADTAVHIAAIFLTVVPDAFALLQAVRRRIPADPLLLVATLGVVLLTILVMVATPIRIMLMTFLMMARISV